MPVLIRSEARDRQPLANAAFSRATLECQINRGLNKRMGWTFCRYLRSGGILINGGEGESCGQLINYVLKVNVKKRI